MSSNSQVQHLWANHRAGDSNNLHSDGTVLKSYSTPIAVWINNVAFISSNGMSPTTASKHLSGLASACRGSETFYTPAFNYHDRTPPNAAACLCAAADEMTETFKKILRMRTYVNESIEHYEQRRAQILDLAERFKIGVPDMPEATGDLKEKAKELAAKERTRKAEQKQREEERQRAQKIIDQGQLDMWLQQGRGSFPSSFRKYGEDSLTIRDRAAVTVESAEKMVKSPTAIVITSQGAEAPLDHVIKALKFYDSRQMEKTPQLFPDKKVIIFAPYHTNGHKIALGNFVLDSIDEAGNVKAGCHTFSAQEIARFRKQWNL